MQSNSSYLEKSIRQKFNSFPIIFGIPLGALNIDPLKNLGGRFHFIDDYITFVLNLTMGVGTALAVIFLVLGGIAWATSQGDPKAIQKAQSKLTWTIIGFVIVIASVAIKTLIGNLLGQTNLPILPGFF